MFRTLLIGNSRTSWRSWLKANSLNADLLCLDPADPTHAFPAQISLIRDGRAIWSRFYGSLDPQRFPHVLIGALGGALNQARDAVVIQVFGYRPTPVLHQSLRLICDLTQPSRVVLAEGTEVRHEDLGQKPEIVELEPSLPPMVQLAQRKAQWLKLLEACQRHTIDLRSVAVEGVRLGTGVALSVQDRKNGSLDSALYAERAGSTLFVISDQEIDESDASKALDYTGCSKMVVTEPGAYRYLLCAFARASGAEFGMGMIQEIDWVNFRAEILCNAVPPAPVHVLRIGSLRVDPDGRELGELRAWQV